MHIYPRSLLAAALTVFGFGGSVFAQAAPQNFISVTPCRIADTRKSNGGAGPIAAQSYRTFPVSGTAGVDGGPACNIPGNASAYSVNVTAVPPSGGSLVYLSVLPATSSTPTSAPSSSTLNDPSGTIIANAAIIPSGYEGAVMVYVSGTSDVILDIDGYFLDQTNPGDSTAVGTGAGGSTGSNNTAVGFNALASGNGSDNSAFGNSSLASNTTGNYNVAFGGLSLIYNTTGGYNSAVGYGALAYNSTGGDNAALGYAALQYNTSGNYNNAFGLQALENETDGIGNDGFGTSALAGVTTGGNNIGIGNNAGQNGIKTGNNNIEIGNVGISSNGTDNNLIAIGTQNVQTATYIAGIYGTTVTGGEAVVVNSSGQVGVQSSSIRFKQDVHDMADDSDALMELRPVEFRYKQAQADGTQPLQFGLVAEEVAKVYPELVSRDKEGQINSVQYHQLPAMLLNEIQKQHRTIEELQAAKSQDAQQIRTQAQQIQILQAEMEKVRALLAGK